MGDVVSVHLFIFRPCKICYISCIREKRAVEFFLITYRGKGGGEGKFQYVFS